MDQTSILRIELHELQEKDFPAADADNCVFLIVSEILRSVFFGI